MNTQLLETLETLKTLPVPERIQLVEDLWDSIAISQADFELTEAQRAELDRRLDALEQNQSPLVSWDDVTSKILADR